jgi:hypothetical protein
MIKNRIRRGSRSFRLQAQNPEEQWHVVLRFNCDMPPFRPSDDEKILGRSKAELRKAALDAALSEEERKTIKHIVQETTPPSRRRTATGPPKYDTYKARGR